MTNLCNEEKTCSGCSACANACPKNAIAMERDWKGFLYPVINEDLCIDCGICERVCDFKKFQPTGHKPSSYAVRHRDAEEVKTSRSGAVFMAMCQKVIERGGVCFGCELDENFEAIHKGEETYQDCAKFKGSKYVQSNPENTFKECENVLREGKWVLYSGTGCQVHGLLSYLKQKSAPMEKLITVDLVCHGVPSPAVWEHYLKCYEKRIGKSFFDVNFRDKSQTGWADHVESYETEDGNKLYTKQFTEMFYRHVLFRESCYSCVYTTPERLSDFTIADYWGVAKNAPEFNDNLGVSHVLIHTEKGKQFFDDIGDLLQTKETNLATSMQPQLQKPIWRGWDYNFFWSAWKKNKDKAIKKYFFPSFPSRAFRAVERCGKNTLKKIIRFCKKIKKKLIGR